MTGEAGNTKTLSVSPAFPAGDSPQVRTARTPRTKTPPPEADVVVWVAMSDVAVWRWVIELDRVTFCEGRGWSSVVPNGGGDLPELAGRDQTELSALFYRRQRTAFIG